MLATTIKKPHMDEILAGTKKAEYHEMTVYWVTRVLNFLTQVAEGKTPRAISLLCGQVGYIYEVTSIECHFSPTVIDGQPCEAWFAFNLGRRRWDLERERALRKARGSPVRGGMPASTSIGTPPVPATGTPGTCSPGTPSAADRGTPPGGGSVA